MAATGTEKPPVTDRLKDLFKGQFRINFTKEYNTPDFVWILAFKTVAGIIGR
jgi:hypothetical protein